MRKIIAALVAFALLAGCVCLAEGAYEQILAADHISLAEAREQIGDVEVQGEEAQAFCQQMADLESCAGRFIQDKGENSSPDRTYTADVEFYYQKGAPYLTVRYTNYAGELSDAPVEPTEEEGYLFVAHPEGKLFSRQQAFTIYLGVEDMRVIWADGDCDYHLSRGNGDVSEADEVPDEEKESFIAVIDAVDRIFSSMEHSHRYVAENKTLYVYVAMGDGMRQKLLTGLNNPDLQETWQELVEQTCTASDKLGTVLTLAVRDGMMDYSKATCTVLYVETLNDANEYYAQDTLCVISNGEVMYDINDDVAALQPSGAGGGGAQGSASPQAGASSGDTSSATMGERNALESARNYLEVIPFSYEGLVEQLEYEGYSHSEAVYGADYCGANWFEQAALKARSYLDIMSFSRSGLIEQLEYEGFTHEQAVYGVEQNGY